VKIKILPLISFVIPTLNASNILSKCLESIRTQHYPQKNIEIVIADGGSIDNTRDIGKKFHAKVINNPEILHEPGKSIASKIAKGDIIFYTDSDNILTHPHWISMMVKPYLENSNVIGFLPQTIPAPDSNSLDRYLGYLTTDPFTWFIYDMTASPSDYTHNYKPIKSTKEYMLYQFPLTNIPLFGLSQGVGVIKKFKKNKKAYSDDLLAGIKLIEERGIIAYIPKAGVYHYHVDGYINFIKKYTWRVRNNLNQQIQGMGITNRTQYFPKRRIIRMYLFVPYGITILFAFIDSIKLSIKHHDAVMLLHPLACFILSIIIIKEYFQFILQKNKNLGTYQ